MKCSTQRNARVPTQPLVSEEERLWKMYLKRKRNRTRNQLKALYYPMAKEAVESVWNIPGGFDMGLCLDEAVDALDYCLDHFTGIGDFRKMAMPILKKRVMSALRTQRVLRQREVYLASQDVFVDYDCRSREMSLQAEYDELVRNRFELGIGVIYYLIYHLGYTQTQVAILLGLDSKKMARLTCDLMQYLRDASCR